MGSRWTCTWTAGQHEVNKTRMGMEGNGMQVNIIGGQQFLLVACLLMWEATG